MATNDDVRELALGLPGTSEKPSYGTPGFRVKDKLFARLRSVDRQELTELLADSYRLRRGTVPGDG